MEAKKACMVLLHALVLAEGNVCNSQGAVLMQIKQKQSESATELSEKESEVEYANGFESQFHHECVKCHTLPDHETPDMLEVCKDGQADSHPEMPGVCEETLNKFHELVQAYGKTLTPQKFCDLLVTSARPVDAAKVDVMHTVAEHQNQQQQALGLAEWERESGDEPCFPAQATVETEHGLKAMADLKVGEKVLALDDAGNPFFDDVAFFGHADPEGQMYVQRISVEGVSSGEQRRLELSLSHFLPMCPRHGQQCAWSHRKHAYARTVKQGDYLWMAGYGQISELVKVSNISVVKASGLYNPYTLGGSIVVDGVVASAHSNWFLDSLLVGHEEKLPSIYQAILSPGFLLYRAVGVQAADWLKVNNPQELSGLGGTYGLHFLASVFLTTAAVSCGVAYASWRIAVRKV